MRKFLLLLFLLIFCNSIFGSTITVTNTNDGGLGSLRNQIINASDGDEIIFSPSLISSGSNTVLLLSEISFSKNLTIRGLYNATDTLYLSGGGTNRIFNISSTQSVVLDSLCFVNGYVVGNGGAVSGNNVDYLLVSDCVFTQNQAANPYRGGGLHFLGNSTTVAEINSLIIENCSFIQNTAGYGGGFSSTSYINYPNTVSLNSSVFKDNTGDFGGAILYESYTDSISSEEPFQISGCAIANNFSQNHGGGILMASYGYTSIKAKLLDSKIIGNTSTGSGGGVFYACHSETDALLLILNSEIEDNQAGDGGGIAYSGYSDSLSDLKLQIVNSSVSNNVGINIGGGIQTVVPGQYLSKIKIEILESTLEGNFLNGSNPSGSALLVLSNFLNPEIVIKNATITNNKVAGGNGGGINIMADTVDFQISSSIVAFNGFTNFSLSSPIVSGGFNIFSDASITGSVSTDQLGTDSLQLNLGALSYNGGDTKTRLPLSGSFAVDAGNLLDFVNAQNAPIFGIRDAGAAESCFSKEIDYQISCVPYTWINGITYTSSNNSATFLLTNTLGCDSLIRLNLVLLPGAATIGFASPNTLAGNILGDSVQWLNCDNGFSPVPGANQVNFTPTDLGNYAFVVYFDNCSDTSDCFSVADLSTETLVNNSFEVYPNPSTGEFFIRMAPEQIIGGLILRNTKGQIVRQWLPSEFSNTLQISIADLADGCYFLSVLGKDREVYTTDRLTKMAE